MQDIKIVSLFYYPIKSCRGSILDYALINNRGIKYDRAFMVTDTSGNFLTQRKYPRMALIYPQLDEVYLELSAQNIPDITIKHKNNGVRKEVKIWKDDCLAIDQGDDVALWLSDFLEIECRLVQIMDDYIRPVNSQYRINKNNQVSFADGFPFLLISEESLEDLNQRMEKQIPINRFRPNIVVNGCLAYAEDNWNQIRIGSITFTVAKPCERCVIPTIDQETVLKDKEPLFTLNRYRGNKNGKVEFGQNMIHHSSGEIKVGDKIEVLA